MGSDPVFSFFVILALLAGDQRVRATDLLDLYLKGDHAAAIAPLVKVANVRNLVIDLEVDGGDWISKGATPQDVARRRLAAASLALEFAVVRMEDEWLTVLPLVEWGCAQLVKDPPRDAELAWHRAAMAAMQGARASVFNRRHPVCGVPRDAPAGLGRLAHSAFADARFPNDPALLFARAFFADMEVPVEGTARLVDIDTAATESARAIGFYKAAAADPLLAHESALAIGYIHLRMKRLDAVLPELAKAAESADPFVRYLAHLLRGRTLEHLGGREEAASAYRAALAVLPNTQSAAMALAALSHTGDQPHQAVELMSASFRSRPSVDPWREYGFGQFRHWQRYRDRLREVNR